MSWNLDETLAKLVSEQIQVNEKTAEKVIDLFEQGNEIAYIARYKVDIHKLSCEKIRHFYETYLEKKELNEKVSKAIKSIEAKASPEEATLAISELKQAREFSDILEITKLFASARKTKADQARNLGLVETADAILQGKSVNLSSIVDKSKDGLKNKQQIEENLKFLLAEQLNKLPETIELAKEISQLKTRTHLAVSTSFSKKATKKEAQQFEIYKDFTKDAKTIQNYQILALIRGEEKEVLSWKIAVETSFVENSHPGKSIKVAKEHLRLYLEALSYSVSNHFIPKIKRAVKKYLSQRAELGAIACFSRNVTQLFSQEGLKDHFVLALDPGYKACKIALLQPDGSVISTKNLFFSSDGFNKEGEEHLQKLVNETDGKVVIAIGSGSASAETQKVIQELMSRKKFFSKDVSFCEVSESGASKYSITELAEKELPNIPVTEKSAVSIGRRLIDPVAEYVKIDPRHLGLGMYQHSVNEKKLSEALDLVVRDCVSLCGVDVNSASLQLLKKVCGLNQKTASSIIKLREELGRISSREELKQATGLGAKTFRNCAGFLMISAPSSFELPPVAKKRKTTMSQYNPLDATTVHPESYDVAKKILKRAKVTVAELGTDKAKQQLKELKERNEEESLIIDLLTSKKTLISHPQLMKEIRKFRTLKVGEVLTGRVMNQTDFGIFIDIGAEITVLCHSSSLAKPFPEIGSQIQVKIQNKNTLKRRIEVTPC